MTGASTSGLWGRSANPPSHCALPLGNGLLIDAVVPGQRSQALLTMLYRSTDRLCRCGAAVENLAHNASFHSLENNAPSNPGVKHLGAPLAWLEMAAIDVGYRFSAPAWLMPPSSSGNTGDADARHALRAYSFCIAQGYCCTSSGQVMNRVMRSGMGARDACFASTEW